MKVVYAFFYEIFNNKRNKSEFCCDLRKLFLTIRVSYLSGFIFNGHILIIIKPYNIYDVH